MKDVSTSEFARLENSQLGPGTTKEFTTPHGETLAYIDYTEDRTEAWATIFNPYRNGRREYSKRSAAAAEAIVARHIEKY